MAGRLTLTQKMEVRPFHPEPERTIEKVMSENIQNESTVWLTAYQVAAAILSNDNKDFTCTQVNYKACVEAASAVKNYRETMKEVS